VRIGGFCLGLAAQYAAGAVAIIALAGMGVTASLVRRPVSSDNKAGEALDRR
jgi:hypothetical protein